MGSFFPVCAAVAAAGVIGVSSASAALITSGPVSIPVPRDFTGLGLNLVTGETSRVPSNQLVDFNVFDLNGEWRLAQLDNFAGGGIVAASTGAVATGGPPALLGVGDFVGPGLPLLQGGGLVTNGVFDGVQGAFLGIFFENEPTNTLHYGYVKITLPSVGDGVITEFGYESEPMTGFVIPSPGGAVLAAVAGVAAVRRRR